MSGAQSGHSAGGGAEARHRGVSVVLPVLDERDNLAPLHDRLTAALASLGRDYEIIYVDDGSTDGSWDVLTKLAEGDRRGLDLHTATRCRKPVGST